METELTEDILCSVKHHVGLITLNRPNALNALNFSMFKSMLSQLLAWQADDTVHAVVIQAVPGRAFCAGGDVRWVYDEGRKSPSVPLKLFYHEYRLDYLTSQLGKPYIALMDGLTIGGGVGVTLHGSHAVASERFAFTMPEVSIGLFPDIGASHLLCACPDGVGLYLGLTGRRVNAADSKTLGLVDYTVPQHAFDAIREDLFSADLSTEASLKVSNCLMQYEEKMPAGSLVGEMAAIQRCFGDKHALYEVFDALDKENTTWAMETKALLLAQSPLSLHVTFQQLQRAKGLDLKSCLSMDYDLVYHFLKGHDFYEGVRARLVDKDKAPCWQASWDTISEDAVRDYFKKPTKIEPLW